MKKNVVLSSIFAIVIGLLFGSLSYASGLSGQYVVKSVVLGPPAGNGQNLPPNCNIFSNYGNAQLGTTIVIAASATEFSLSVIVPPNNGLGPSSTMVTDDDYKFAGTPSPYNSGQNQFNYAGPGFSVSVTRNGDTLNIHNEVQGVSDAGQADAMTVDCTATYVEN